MNPLTAMEYTRSPPNAVRPTIAPDVMVEHVSANANWNKKNARNATPVEPYVVGALFKKKYWCPIQPLPVPNMNAKPNAQKSKPHRHVSAMHSNMMLETSRVRPNPASSIMKPACMKKTRNAATSTHTVLRGLMMSSAFVAAVCVSIAAPAFVLKYQASAHMPNTTTPSPAI